MTSIEKLFENNKKWVEDKLKEDSQYFESFASGQSPKYLWIGCADSRVVPEKLLGLEPGEVFVHRNIANLCIHSDISFQCLLEFAIKVLGVEHIIVCGHYGCAGVKTAMGSQSVGIVDHWIRHIRDVYKQHKEKLSDPKKALKQLIELNAIEQAKNISYTHTVQQAWKDGKSLSVHSFVYDVSTGLLKNLNASISSIEQVDALYHN